MQDLTSTNRHVLSCRGYKVVKLLAAGAFGKVFEAWRAADGLQVAVKVVPLGSLQTREVRMMETEIEILSSLQHPNIVQFHESFTDSAVLGAREDCDTVYIVSEYLRGGDLYERITTKLLTETQALDVAKQVLSGLTYLESRDICHRDIKLENMCIADSSDGKLSVKIIDFGFATRLDGASMVSGARRAGTLNYYPPQIVQRRDYDPHRMDVWSLGVVLYSAVCGRFPFFGQGEAAIEKMITDNDPSFHEPQWAEISPQFQAAVSRMLTKEQTFRPNLRECLNDILRLQRSEGVRVSLKKASFGRGPPLRAKPTGRPAKWIRKSPPSSLDIVHAAIMAT